MKKSLLEKDLIELKTRCMNYEYIALDLDGTFVKEELMKDFLIKKAWKKPFVFMKIVWLFAYDKFAMKKYIAKFIEKWTVREWLLDLMNDLTFRHNKVIILATGSHVDLAKKIKAKYSVIQHVLGTVKHYNCVGSNKYYSLEERFGKNFFYIGNSWQDVEFFDHVSDGCLITKNKKIINHALKMQKHLMIIKD